MNTQHRDILTAIGRKQPITTSGVAEYLMDHFGYGGGMTFEAFRDQVSKTIGYLKSKGDITGEDRTQPKGKPLRYWSLAESQLEEMASDVAELEQPQSVVNDSLTTEAVAEECSDAAETDAEKYRLTMTASLDAWGKGEDIAVEFKPAHKSLTVRQILDGFEHSSESFQDDLCDFRLFAAGVEFAEKHHGIG